MGKAPKFGSAAEAQKHVKQNALVAHDGARFFLPTKFKFLQKTLELADDGTYTLPFNVTYAAWGWITSGSTDGSNIGAYATFLIDGDGDVTLLTAHSSVVANSDTDGKLCLGTAASQEPLVIKNRVGSTKRVTLFIVCN